MLWNHLLFWWKHGKNAQIEDLDSYVEEAFGTVPETFLNKKMAFYSSASFGGVKKAWFLWHRETANHANFCDDKARVRVFSYLVVGVQALLLAHRYVTFIDASEKRLIMFRQFYNWIHIEVALNWCMRRIWSHAVFDWTTARFDVVVWIHQLSVHVVKTLKQVKAYHRANQIGDEMSQKVCFGLGRLALWPWTDAFTCLFE